MKQADFERRGEPLWRAFAEELSVLEASARAVPSPQFAHHYRQICQAHALCERRQYTAQLEMQLADLVVRGQRYLYRRPTRFVQAFWRFVISGFPSAVRREARLFALVSALFYLPALGLAWALSFQPDLIYSLMPPQAVQHLENMYQPDNITLGEARDSGTNWEMFGFYIRNNIGVAFRTCASGLLLGVGSLLLLLYNGLMLGGAAAHLTHLGYQQTFFTFVIGHGSFELTAIVIAAVAGLKLGLALVAPGRLPRL
ncbi:MAG TPA: stage II sporulation protein M, partial [Cellvibrionaceae bacterium]|nr:stage II sporulation protein M [Cellvibrionaceae bacterium]